MRPLAAMTRPMKKMFLVFKEFIVAAAMSACPIVPTQAIMGQHDRSEALFYYFRLEDQVPETHLLRLIGYRPTLRMPSSKLVTRLVESESVLTLTVNQNALTALSARDA